MRDSLGANAAPRLSHSSAASRVELDSFPKYGDRPSKEKNGSELQIK